MNDPNASRQRKFFCHILMTFEDFIVVDVNCFPNPFLVLRMREREREEYFNGHGF